MLELEQDMEELQSAEDFLEYFSIDFEQKVVHVNRLHILQRFHNYISQIENMPETDAAMYTLYATLLKTAYQDFVQSDAITEKVFKVFKMHEPQQVLVPVSSLKVRL